MYHPNRILERELEFTKIYRENIGQPKAVRESRCMDAQMATYFVTIQPQDLIAGRISRPYVVFAQCMEGDGIDKTIRWQAGHLWTDPQTMQAFLVG